MKIHFNSIVVDGHNDTMMNIIDEKTWLPIIDIGDETSNHIDIPKLKAGGLNVPFFSAYTKGYYNNTQRSLSRTLALINALYWTQEKNPNTFKIIRSVGEIQKVICEEKIAAVATIEGAYSLNKENAIELIKQYYDLGIKLVGFNWNYSNELGEGASRIYPDDLGIKSTGGLTKLGEEVTRKMNELGMVVDVSHMDEGTFWGVINTSRSPIIASHCGVYQLKNHKRNLKDEQLKALAKNGGVVGIVLYPNFLKDSNIAYIKDYVDHIDYVVKLIGVDYVGIGSDFDGASLVEDMKDSSEFYKITKELIKRGYNEDEIKKILGKNMLRVLKEVEDLGKANLNTPKLKLNIIPDYKMGERILDYTPLIRARIENPNNINMSELDYKIIVDGISHKAEYNKDESIMYLKINESLKEKFHLVTFQISHGGKEAKRETRIFYNGLIDQ